MKGSFNKVPSESWFENLLQIGERWCHLESRLNSWSLCFFFGGSCIYSYLSIKLQLNFNPWVGFFYSYLFIYLFLRGDFLFVIEIGFFTWILSDGRFWSVFGLPSLPFPDRLFSLRDMPSQIMNKQTTVLLSLKKKYIFYVLQNSTWKH